MKKNAKKKFKPEDFTYRDDGDSGFCIVLLPGEELKELREKTPNELLLMASEKGEIETVKDLLNAEKYNGSVDINAKGLSDFTPLHFAASEGHLEIVRELLRMGANIEATSSSLRTPLHIACINGRTEVILVLIEHKANVNAQDIFGSTPIHILSANGQLEALEICLRANPDLNIRNMYRETPIEAANTIETRRSLTRLSVSTMRGSTTEAVNYYTRTVIQNVVLRNNRADMIKNLLFRSQQIESNGFITGPPKESVNRPKIEPSSDIKKRPKLIRAVNSLSFASPASDFLGEEERKVGLKDFDLIHLLGKGSFGEVYLVRYRPLSKLYAMKVLKKSSYMILDRLRYVMAERDILCAINHPFIVSLDFSFQTSDDFFLVLKYCPG